MSPDDPRQDGPIAGLTCCHCWQPLYPALAARTDDGWRHQPGSCGCRIEDCQGAHHARGYCRLHYMRLRDHGDPLYTSTATVEAIRAAIEDAEWMADTGECLTGAARRLGRTVDGLDKLLRRHGRSDIYRTLASREGEWNASGRYGRDVARASPDGAPARPAPHPSTSDAGR